MDAQLIALTAVFACAMMTVYLLFQNLEYRSYLRIAAEFARSAVAIPPDVDPTAEQMRMGLRFEAKRLALGARFIAARLRDCGIHRDTFLFEQVDVMLIEILRSEEKGLSGMNEASESYLKLQTALSELIELATSPSCSSGTRNACGHWSANLSRWLSVSRRCSRPLFKRSIKDRGRS